MRKFLKIFLGIVAGLVGLIAVLLCLIYWRSDIRLGRTYHVEVAPPHLPMDGASLETGRHLAASRGCIGCHGADLGGATLIDDPAMGRISGPNLTRGLGGLPPGYSDGDYVRAIRHGIAADGHGLFLMPSADFAHLTEADMTDLIAYAKSVPPVDRKSVPLRIGPVARGLLLAGKITLAADVIDHVGLKPDIVEIGPTVAYGRYLAVSCTGCHGSNFSGGKITIGPPGWPHAANLTPHPSGRLAHWTEADFATALRTKRRPDGTRIDPVMPDVFGQLNDTELKAIWAFLRALPPVPTGAR